MTTLDKIAARADAATEGPWAVEVDDDGFDGASVHIDDVGWGTAYICQEMHQGESEGVADATFIANAREDVPKLVAALRAVEAAMGQLDEDRADGTIRTYGQIQRAVRDAIREALDG